MPDVTSADVEVRDRLQDANASRSLRQTPYADSRPVLPYILKANTVVSPIEISDCDDRVADREEVGNYLCTEAKLFPEPVGALFQESAEEATCVETLRSGFRMRTTRRTSSPERGQRLRRSLRGIPKRRTLQGGLPWKRSVVEWKTGRFIFWSFSA
jgi:hypothetical protein